MATLNNILSPVWTLSKNGGGSVVEGVEAIKQCIDIILRTTKGSDPLRSGFGSNIYLYQDAPVNIAIPSIKKAIIDSITQYEKRVTITSIQHTINGSNLIFVINFKVTDTDLQDSITASISNGGVTTSVTPSNMILRGYFPANPSGYQYSANLILNGQNILPLMPGSGFASLSDLFVWIQSNWSNYGNWYFTSNSIVGYISPGYTTGSFTISVLSNAQFRGLIPTLGIGYKYDVQITVDGVLTENTTDLFTAADVLTFAQLSLNSLGTWYTEVAAGSFSDDFSDDFDTYQTYLAINTGLASAILININTISI